MHSDDQTGRAGILDEQIAQVVARARAADAAKPHFDPDPHRHRAFGYPLGETAAGLLYLLARATGATRIVEFATSIGISTLHLAAAVRDNGGGIVIGSEIVPDKITVAQANLAAAGLEGYVEIRPGDALETLVDVGGPIDLVLLDGWPTGEGPSLDLRVLQLLTPQLRSGALVLDDNAEPDVLAFLQDPANGYRSLTLGDRYRPFELALRV